MIALKIIIESKKKYNKTMYIIHTKKKWQMDKRKRIEINQMVERGN